MVTCSTVLDRTPNKCSILQVVVLTDVDAPVCTNLQAALQSSLFGSAELRCGPIGPPTDRLDSSSSITFAPGWLDGSDVVFDRLRDDLPWRAMERPMYDRIVPVPRLICTVDIGSLGGTHPLADNHPRARKRPPCSFFVSRGELLSDRPRLCRVASRQHLQDSTAIDGSPGVVG